MAAGQWRYIAQRMDGSGALGEFLDFDVPLIGGAPEEVLSGHNSLTGTITPEYMRLKGPDGRPILEEWGSAIWAESPDGNLWGGILTHSSFSGPDWSIECTDISCILDNLPYTEANFWVNVDPLDIFRHIWSYAQHQAGGNVGATIDPTTSPIRLGTDLVQRVEFDLEYDPSAGLEDDPAPTAPVEVAPNRYANNADWREAAVDALAANGWKRSVVDDALKKWLNKDSLVENNKWEPLTDKERTIKERAVQKLGMPPNPPNGSSRQIEPHANVRVAAYGTVYGDGTVDTGGGEAPTENPVYEYDAYKLNWYTNFDLNAEVNSLASSTPFDWHVTHWWHGEEIRHHVRVGYPRLGRRLVDERFVIGENIHVIPTIERDGSEYANEVLFLGAGEGSSQIMGRAFRRDDGRLRKVVTVSDTSVTTVADANARAQQELNVRFNIENVADIVLLDHPHAPIGSVSVGDEILLEGETGWTGLGVWCRVVGRRLDPDNSNSVSLTLIRTDRLS